MCTRGRLSARAGVVPQLAGARIAVGLWRTPIAAYAAAVLFATATIPVGGTFD